MSSSASTIFLSWLATGIYNLDSKRFQKASLNTRVEGWTETWGNKEENEEVTNEEETTTSDADVKTKSKSDTIGTEIDDRSVSILLSTPHPQLPIVLTQHRPAWLEQMVLRIAGIPHIVINSKYISNEATGQLPYLSDCIPSKPPILVGRDHPTNLETNTTTSNNSILAYLQDYRDVDLDRQASLTSDTQRGLSRCFQMMIHSELSNIMLYLRYEDSDSSWEQVYRKQYIEASNIIIPNKEPLSTNEIRKNSWVMQLRGRLQASMERAVERKRLLGFDGEKNSIKKLLQRANDAYSTLDNQLSETNKNTTKQNYLLGTERPALVDVLLWAHLAEALCDVHLVVLLASHPNLVKYFQHMYRTYFSTSDEKCDWKDWNEQQNLNNAFQKIPTLGKPKQTQASAFKDAVDLMQKLSLQKQELIEVLGAVKAKRMADPLPKPRQPTSSVMYRYCMGSESLKNKKNQTPTEKEQNPIRQKLMRDQVRNDQMWISGIVGVSAVVILLIQGGNTL